MLCARDYCPLSGPVEIKVGCHNAAILSVKNFRRDCVLAGRTSREVECYGTARSAEASLNGLSPKGDISEIAIFRQPSL